MTATETTRRRHALKRTLEGGGGWSRERGSAAKLDALVAAVERMKRERAGGLYQKLNGEG